MDITDKVSSGKYKRASSKLAISPRHKVANTPTSQLSTLPRRPFHCRATPVDAVPFLAKALSSKINTDSGPPNNASLDGRPR